MFSLIEKYWSRGKTVTSDDSTWSKADRRIQRPSEEDFEALEMKKKDPDSYVSDSYTDPSSRGGPLGTENEMPDGGDSTRGMSKGPASKSPMP
jgi:hypothetical protein